MRRLRWLLLVCAPALLLVVVRLGLGHGTERPPRVVTPAVDEVAGAAPQRPEVTRGRGAAVELATPAEPEAPADQPGGAEDRPDPWALPESDPRRGLVDAFRGMNDDTSPAEAERQYLAALERGVFASEAWTGAARTAAQAWFAGLGAQVTCYAGGCAATLTTADAGALVEARQRIAQQAAAAGWQGPVITAPAVAEEGGRQRQMWIFVRPE